MKLNEDFIAGLSQRIERVNTALLSEFGELQTRELNWRPKDRGWSIGLCFVHLMKANAAYFPLLSSVIDGTTRTRLLERIPVLPGLWGNLILKMVEPETARRSRAPKVFLPLLKEVPGDIVERFIEQQHELLALMTQLGSVDLDETTITSPALAIVTYSLRDALSIIVAHEERHLLQARRVLVEMLETTSG
jgi:uncharacterized damage-inducible protein DinB